MQFFRKEQTLDQLIAGCLKNDRKSQEKLYRQFFPTMERMIRRHTNDKDQIIDIINNGFLKVFKKLDSYGHQGSFEGWVRKIIYHSMCDYFKKYEKDLKFLVFGTLDYDVRVKTGNDLYYQDLMKMVDSLPEKQHQVFRLYCIEGYKHHEIAEQLNFSPNTSKWYLAEARKKLQNQYKAELLNYEIR